MFKVNNYLRVKGIQYILFQILEEPILVGIDSRYLILMTATNLPVNFEVGKSLMCMNYYSGNKATFLNVKKKHCLRFKCIQPISSKDFFSERCLC